MKQSLFRCSVLAFAVALALPTLAQQPAAADKAPWTVGGVAGADVTTLQAKIEAVDVAKRLVTVKGPMGHVVTLKVGDQVKNLAQVKVGDEIVLKYLEAVSVALTTGGGARSATTATSAPVTAPAGAKPGMAMARQTKIVAKVDSLDAARQEVLLHGPKGNYVEVKVKNPAVFKSIKVGDNVEVTYTEAVVLDVVKPGAAGK